MTRPSRPIAWAFARRTPTSAPSPRRKESGWKAGSPSSSAPRRANSSAAPPTSAAWPRSRRPTPCSTGWSFCDCSRRPGCGPEGGHGGWNSRGYKDFREIAPALCDLRHDPSEGYAYLLQLIFEDLATDLPGLFGSAGIADLIPVPTSTLRAVVEAFDDPELASCWTDDMTLGWVYQYWNDPGRACAR